MTEFFAGHGSAPLRAKGHAIGWIGQQLPTQASFPA